MASVRETTSRASLPGNDVYMVAIPNTPASDATKTIPLMVMPYRAKLVEVAIVNADAVVTGHATNRKNFNLIDDGPEGGGNTTIANLNLDAGVNLAVGKTLMTIASAPRFMAQGTILALQIEQVGTGVALPGLLFYVVIRPSESSS